MRSRGRLRRRGRIEKSAAPSAWVRLFVRDVSASRRVAASGIASTRRFHAAVSRATERNPHSNSRAAARRRARISPRERRDDSYMCPERKTFLDASQRVGRHLCAIYQGESTDQIVSQGEPKQTLNPAGPRRVVRARRSTPGARRSRRPPSRRARNCLPQPVRLWNTRPESR
jgi:hypothetical protein